MGSGGVTNTILSSRYGPKIKKKKKKKFLLPTVQRMGHVFKLKRMQKFSWM